MSEMLIQHVERYAKYQCFEVFMFVWKPNRINLFVGLFVCFIQTIILFYKLQKLLTNNQFYVLFFNLYS